jgi:phosphosulfolactate synthase
MNASELMLPPRSAKPRKKGLTILIDNGVPTRYFEDVVESASQYVDLVKFGWGTSIVSDHLERKIATLQRLGVDYFFGGTLFEKFYSQRKLAGFVAYCQRFGCRFIEISNGTIQLANADKARVITELAGEFKVLSEVGFKDSEASQLLSPSAWIDYIHEDLAAGAVKTITEARESGTSGICRPDGELRYGLIEDIIRSDLKMDDLVFEAPNKTLQAYFIRRLGTNVNLANIAFTDVIGVETLRLGLRSDTLLAFDEPSGRNRRGGRYA